MADEVRCVNLLEQLTKYDLLLEQLQKSMTEGFYNLGRANYHNKDSLRGRYGMDYWDDTYEGYLVADIDQDKHITIVKRNPVVNDTCDEKETDLNFRGSRGEETHPKEEKKRQTVQVDPITMFGGSLTAPVSLRQCQVNFKGGMALVEELVNCRNNIDALIRELEPK